MTRKAAGHIQSMPWAREVVAARLAARIGVKMIPIPAGKFTFQGVKGIHNDAFFMAETPFTNGQFGKLLALEPERISKVIREPEKLLKMSESVAHFPNESKDSPLVYATRKEAEGIVALLGMQLPTELEWERMASFTDGRQFPWGSWPEMKPNYAVYNCMGTRKVKKHSFRTPEGFYDVAGNVLERTRSIFGDIDLSDPKNIRFPEKGVYWVLRGGSFTADLPRYLMCTYRIPDTLAALGRSCDKNVGFRLSASSLLMRLALGIIKPRS